MNNKNNITKSANSSDEFIRIQDLGRACLAKWPWFLVSIVLAMAVAFAYLAVTPNIYTRSMSILIKDSSKSGNSATGMEAFSELGIFQSNTNIQNEMQIMKSPSLMTEVVERLGLNRNYMVKEGFRPRTLYKQTPIQVLTDSLHQHTPMAFDIELLEDNGVRLSNFNVNGIESDLSVESTLAQPIATVAGIIYINPTPEYKFNTHRQIHYWQSAPASIAKGLAGALSVGLNDERSSIVNLSISDNNIRRAEDVLTTLVDVYNENWVKDRNQMAISTSLFIQDRLAAIEQELGNVDENISSFKSEHLMPDAQAAASMYMAQSQANTAELTALNNRISIARYIREYLESETTQGQLLPANSGIENSNIETQISEYNTLLLQRNRLLAGSSEKNPLVIDLNATLAALRQAIIKSVDNLLEILNKQVENVLLSERQTNARIASNPDQAKYLLTVERQQKVKEGLYLYLLQKREENELSQAFSAYNTRIITTPSGSMAPTTPVKRNILLIAFIIGLLIPAVIIFFIETLNTAVRGRKDLESLSIPFIGEIPLSYRKKKQKGQKQKTKSKEDEDVQRLVVKELSLIHI